MKKLLLCLFIVFSFAQEDIDTELMLQDGERIYKETCVSCHGKNGQTNDKMKLVVKPRKLNKTILTMEQSYKIIKYGAHYWGADSDIMPSFKYVYDEEMLRAVAYYISKSFNPNNKKIIKELLNNSKKIYNKTTKQMILNGKSIFLKKCSLCHGIDGKTKGISAINSKKQDFVIYPYNLERTLLNEDQIYLYIKEGGKFWGTYNDHMPSWKSKYTDYDIRSVAKFVSKNIVDPNITIKGN